MKFFYNTNEEIYNLENIINLKIREFISEFSKNEIFKNYIKSFGIIGPASRGEGFYINKSTRSDVDLYLVTNYISIGNSQKINDLFNDIFDKKLDVSLLLFSPNSLKKPDLMMYELTNSGICLFGDKLKKINFNQISKFESVRNLVYRGFYFLDNFEIINNNFKIKENISNEKFLYGFSKIVFALGEVGLIIEGKYTASNFQRAIDINNCKILKEIDGFLELHNLMHDFRYNNKKIDFEILDFSKKGFNFLLLGYQIIFENIFNTKDFNSKRFKNIKAKGISFFANRILYSLNMFLKYKKIKIYLFKEPFIDFVLNYIYFLQKLNNGDKVYIKDFELLKQNWKTAPWLYYKI